MTYVITEACIDTKNRCCTEECPVVLGGFENHTEEEVPPPDDAPCLDVRLQLMCGGAEVKVGRPRALAAA